MDTQQAPSTFRAATRQQIVPLAGQTAVAFGQKLTFPLPQTGYLAKIWLPFTATLTTNATAAGTQAVYPPMPWSAINRVRLYTNEGATLVDVSGYELYLYNMWVNRLSNPAIDLVTGIGALNANNKANLYVSPSGALAASTQYIHSGVLQIPIFTDDTLMLGLLLTQNVTTRLNLDVVFGNVGDVSVLSAGGFASQSLAVNPECEFYSVPLDSMTQPNLRFVRTLISEVQPVTLANGDFVYKPQISNIYARIIGMMENGATLAQMAVSNINRISLRYAQTITPYAQGYVGHIARHKFYSGWTMPDGMWAYDFTTGSGSMGIWEPRDFLDSAGQTDLSILVNIGNAALSGAQCRIIKEQLAVLNG